MKNKFFIGLTITASLLISAFFVQTTTAQSNKIAKTKPSTCKVKKNNTNFFVTATEKTIKLRKGTLLSWTIYNMHQGLIVVRAKISKKWMRGEILLEDTTCN